MGWRGFFDRLADGLGNLGGLDVLGWNVGPLSSYCRSSRTKSHRCWDGNRRRNKESILLELELLNILLNQSWPDRLRSLLNINNRSVVVDTDVIVDELRVGPLVDQLIVDHYFLLSSNCRGITSLDELLLASLDDLLLIFSKELQRLNVPIQQRKVVDLTERVRMPDALQPKGRRLHDASSPIERKFPDPCQGVFLLLRDTSPIVHLIHKGFLRVSHAGLGLID